MFSLEPCSETTAPRQRMSSPTQSRQVEVIYRGGRLIVRNDCAIFRWEAYMFLCVSCIHKRRAPTFNMVEATRPMVTPNAAIVPRLEQPEYVSDGSVSVLLPLFETCRVPATLYDAQSVNSQATRTTYQQ